MEEIGRLIIQRATSSDEGTPGALTGNGLSLATLELPWRDLNGDGLGDPQTSCITPGTYRCEWRQSPHHGWCYEVTGVIGRSHILIHAANFAGDAGKGWEAQLLGCIAPGKRHGVMPNANGRAQRAVVQSKLAVQELHAAMQQQPFMLTIVAAP